MVPRGGVPLGDAVNALTARPSQGGFWPMIPMQRDPRDTAAFGPLHPLAPAPIDAPRRDSGRPEPRTYEYPVAWNIPGNDNRPVPWEVLRAASIGVDIIRRCIEIRKKHVRALKWSWALTEEAIADALREDPKRGRDDVEFALREKFLPDIRRLNEFWRKPWRSQGLRFGQWVNGVMEDHLTLDAIAIYPRVTYGGDVTGFELIDGTTIKPLLDSHGRVPVAPHPAYQQILYGFPRGEFTANVEETPEGVVIPGGYTSDRLHYHRENYRTNSPYGLSAVEQALLASRLYLKRQGWMLAEYDDGATPLTWLVPDGDKYVGDQLNPAQRRIYEQALNDDLAGDSARRHRIKMSYPGYSPVQMESVDERYKPDYDLHLIKWVASFFGVMLTELGFTEAKGLGNSGLHEGQEAAEDRVGLGPDVMMLSGMVDELGHAFQKAPPEIEFTFIDPGTEDEQEAEAAADGRMKRATITLNDDRKRLGMATFDFPEADMPFLAGPSGPIFIEGSLARAEQAQANADVMAQAKANPQGVDKPVDDEKDDESSGTRQTDESQVSKAVEGEIVAFRRWLRKNAGRTPARPFRFEYAEPGDVEGVDPALVEFDEWVWVAEDIVKALGADILKVYEPWWPRDSKGRWVKRGHLSDVEIDAKLPEGGRAALRQIREMEQKAQARKPRDTGRVRDASGTVRGMTQTSEPRSIKDIRRESDAVDRELMQIDQVFARDRDTARIEELRKRSDELAAELREAKATAAKPKVEKTSEPRSIEDIRRESDAVDRELMQADRVFARDRDTVRIAELRKRSDELAAELREAKAAKQTPEQANPALRVEAIKSSVRDSVEALQHRTPAGWVPLADIRDDLDSEGYSRAEQDAALRAMAREADVRIVPVADQKNLKQRDRDAGLEIGGEANHVIQIGGDPSQRDKPAEDHSADLAQQRAAQAATRKRLTGDQLTSMRGNTTREQFREKAKEFGLSDTDVDAELDEFGISRERQPGQDTSIGSTLFYRGSVRQSEERREKARAFTPEAYSRLLGEGRGAITHKPTRGVVEAMQAHGWTLHDLAKVGSTWEAPDDSGRRLLLAPGEPPWFADRNGNKLTYKRALELAGGPVTVSAPSAPPGQRAAVGAPETGLSSSVASGVASERVLSGGESADVQLVTFNNGAQAIRKKIKEDLGNHSPKDQADAEELAGHVAAALEVRAPKVERINKDTMYQEYIPGKTAREVHGKGVPDAILSSDQGVRMGLLDYITNNTDRHAGNWVISDQGIAAIDNGAMFDYSTTIGHNPFGKKHFGEGDSNALTPRDVATVRSRLEALEPEFRRIRRLSWYRRMMANLNEVGRNASGGRDLYAGDMTKAAEGDDVPKAEATPDERWPAWLIDTLIAAAAAKGVAAALESAVAPAQLAADFTEWAAGAAASGIDLDVLGWLRQRGLGDEIARALTPVLEGAWSEGWLAGEESAQAAVGHVREYGSLDGANRETLDVEWSWPVGHPEAARQVLSEDGRIVHLRELLNAQGVRIRGITDTQLDDIASALADGIEAGKTPEQIGRALRGVVTDSKRAQRIAATEVNRAISAATLEAYRRDEVPAKGWMTAFDQRVCPLCEANEEAGAIGLDENFPSGDPHPPAHPWCRCALIPEWPEDIAKSARSAAARTHHDIADEGREYWTRDPEGLAKWAKSPHPWTALYRHLVTKMSPVLARKLTSTYFKIVFGYPPSARQGSNPVGRG